MSFIKEHKLPAELREVESLLSALTPVSVPSALLDRLVDSANNYEDLSFSDSVDSEFVDLERQLSKIGNAAMSEEMITRMANAMDRWHEELPVEEKVVAFGDQPEATKKASRKAVWSAAAAVALLGSLSALVVPEFNSNSPAQAEVASPIQNSQSSLVATSSTPRNAWVVPDSLTHKVINTTESGIVMLENDAPHRRIQVEYLDTIKVLDDQGREIEIERPGVDVVFLPVETN